MGVHMVRSRFEEELGCVQRCWFARGTKGERGCRGKWYIAKLGSAELRGDVGSSALMRSKPPLGQVWRTRG